MQIVLDSIEVILVEFKTMLLFQFAQQITTLHIFTPPPSTDHLMELELPWSEIVNEGMKRSLIEVTQFQPQIGILVCGRIVTDILVMASEKHVSLWSLRQKAKCMLEHTTCGVSASALPFKNQTQSAKTFVGKVIVLRPFSGSLMKRESRSSLTSLFILESQPEVQFRVFGIIRISR